MQIITISEIVGMFYRSGTGVSSCIGTRQTGHVHSIGGSTFLHEMTSWHAIMKELHQIVIRL